MSDLIVLPRHLPAAGLCVQGARAWFKRYGLSFEDFRRGKITAAEIEATGDALGLRVIEVARKEAE